MALTLAQRLARAADGDLSVRAAGPLLEAAEELSSQLTDLIDALGEYVEAEDREDRADAREALSSCAGDTHHELSQWMPPTLPTLTPSEPSGTTAALDSEPVDDDDEETP